MADNPQNMADNPQHMAVREEARTFFHQFEGRRTASKSN
jgi:hypothetical protein